MFNPLHTMRRRCGALASLGLAAALLASAPAQAQSKLSIPAASVSASASDANVAANANDGSLATRWSADATSSAQWLQYNLGGCYKIAYANLAWYNGDSRRYNITIKLSNDGSNWTDVFSGSNSGTTAALKPYALVDRSAKFIRVQSTGSDVNKWVSLSEMEVWSNGAGSCATGNSNPPGVNFNLSGYRLQTLDGNLELKQVDPIGNYSDSYFYTEPSTGAMTFSVPSGAGTTANSHYPRSELRDRATFKMGGTHTLSATMKVLQQPATGQIIIGQIHGEQTGGSELLKLRWTNGDILMGVKTTFGATEQKILIKSGVAIGQSISWTIKLVNNVVTVTVNGTSKSFTYNQSSWADVDLYFKLGSYSQDDQQDGSTAKVAVTALN